MPLRRKAQGEEIPAKTTTGAGDASSSIVGARSLAAEDGLDDGGPCFFLSFYTHHFFLLFMAPARSDES